MCVYLSHFAVQKKQTLNQLSSMRTKLKIISSVSKKQATHERLQEAFWLCGPRGPSWPFVLSVLPQTLQHKASLSAGLGKSLHP